MAVPNLPVFFDMQYVNEKGELTSDAFLYNDNLWQSLDNAVYLLNDIVKSTVASDNTITNDGVVAPSKTTAEITAYGADTGIPVGTIWFDTSVAKLKVKTAASTIETITSS